MLEHLPRPFLLMMIWISLGALKPLISLSVRRCFMHLTVIADPPNMPRSPLLRLIISLPGVARSEADPFQAAIDARNFKKKFATCWRSRLMMKGWILTRTVPLSLHLMLPSMHLTFLSVAATAERHDHHSRRCSRGNPAGSHSKRMKARSEHAVLLKPCPSHPHHYMGRSYRTTYHTATAFITLQMMSLCGYERGRMEFRGTFCLYFYVVYNQLDWTFRFVLLHYSDTGRCL